MDTTPKATGTSSTSVLYERTERLSLSFDAPPTSAAADTARRTRAAASSSSASYPPLEMSLLDSLPDFTSSDANSPPEETPRLHPRTVIVLVGTDLGRSIRLTLSDCPLSASSNADLHLSTELLHAPFSSFFDYLLTDRGAATSFAMLLCGPASKQDELVLAIEWLGLEISQDNVYASLVTLGQVLQLYNAALATPGAPSELAPPLVMRLGTRPRFVTGFNGIARLLAGVPEV